jgi:hypothetical protein
MGTGSLPGVNRLGLDVDHPPPSVVEVEKSRAIPQLLLWAFMACSGVKFTFTLLNTALGGE